MSPTSPRILLMPAQPPSALAGDLDVTARLRGRAPLRVMVAELARALAPGAAAVVLGHERLLTDEDELGMLVHLGAGGREASLGVVFGEETCAEIVVVPRGARAERAGRALARELTAAARLELPADRPRRYVYRPPADWHALELRGATVWMPAGGPPRAGAITVHPARPRAAKDEVHRELLGRDAIAPRRAQRLIRTAHGLEGSLVVLETVGRVIETVVVSDRRFSYPVRLESSEACLGAGRRALEALVESIEPIPTRSVSRAACDVFHHLAA